MTAIRAGPRISIRVARRDAEVLKQGSRGPPQYATTAGDTVYGLHLLRDATARLPHSAPPTARARLASLEAVSLGYLGDRAALKALDDSQRHADASHSADPVWPWVFHFDSAKIASYRAVTAARLGMSKMAADAFAVADDSARSPKQAAIVTVEHARTTTSDGHMDQACALAVAAYDVGCHYDSERVRQAVREFRASLGARAPRRVTAELDERLRSAYTSGAS